jgi:hypothetical protein
MCGRWSSSKLGRRRTRGVSPAAAHVRQHKIWEYAKRTGPGLSAAASNTTRAAPEAKTRRKRKGPNESNPVSAAADWEMMQKRCPSRQGRKKRSAPCSLAYSFTSASNHRSSLAGRVVFKKRGPSNKLLGYYHCVPGTTSNATGRGSGLLTFRTGRR